VGSRGYVDAAVRGSVIGAVLHGTYKISRLIAEGGMGSIYEATHSRLSKKRFAVKILHPRAAEVEELYGRFRREAEIVTGIGHPNIVDVLDFNETDDGLPYMVMEYLEGEDLDARLERLGRLAFDEVVQVSTETASALQAVHDRGVVHRDMKPENIFLVSKTPGQLDGPFSVKLLDFGISKIKNSDSIVTKAHTLLGSVHFMSPEQATGKVKQIDHRSDILALGGICYLMLSGELAYEGDTPFAVINALITEAPRPLGQLVPGLPAAAVQVIERAMAKEREARFDRVEEYAVAFEAAMAPPPARRARQLAMSPVKALAESGPLEAIRTLENPSSAFQGPGLDLAGLGDLELETTEPGFDIGDDTFEQEGDTTAVDEEPLGDTGLDDTGFDDAGDADVDEDGDATMVDQMAPVPFDTPAEQVAVATRRSGMVSFETPAAIITDLPLARDPEDEEIPLATPSSAQTGAASRSRASSAAGEATAPTSGPGAETVSLRWLLYLGLGFLAVIVGIVVLAIVVGGTGT
jgi:serine/threonine protein kinase